jgi:hypothetical protein
MAFSVCDCDRIVGVIIIQRVVAASNDLQPYLITGIVGVADYRVAVRVGYRGQIMATMNTKSRGRWARR